ncbi:FAD-dependent oxidoreductase [Ancylobacter sp. Lp-2]|uniref:NAD(P)/FAD-dependent oxidoreductase n=1 Tax=Ancylobacter sp. Lp-2 TaxID=2881339 RepID=UPI001E2A6E9A|nr:FAD-dependent oxidoreductase [Ancylobacter sp. Lp-2]MCB4769681.1 FAD-dependent oxidoreductase [Ancylobacter sp. Lp-2]
MALTAPIDSTLEGVVWKRTLKETAVAYPPLAGEEIADLVVVGAGYCGLNVALHAAKAGQKVVLIEAGIVGNGASGRNGGYNVPHFPGPVTPSAVEGAIGKKKGRELSELVLGGADAVFRQIDAYQISCSAQQSGWIQPAHSDTSLAKVRKVFDEWKAWGADVTWLSADEVAGRLGAAGYIAGWSNPTGGTVNPYSLSIGLGRAATQEGVRIFERSPVDGIEEGPGGVTVKAGAGRVRARRAIVATNAYTGDFLPQVQRSVVPVYLYHAATRPLRPELRASILPTGLCFTDLRKSGGFGRLDEAGRLISGGAVFALGDKQAYGFAHARARMKLLFPQLTDADMQFDDYWEGYCAVTESYLPHVQRLGKEVFSVVGFSTRGVNLAQNLGRVVGEFAAGNRTLDEVPVAVIEQRRDIANWSLKVRAARLVFPLYQAKDRLGLS